MNHAGDLLPHIFQGIQKKPPDRRVSAIVDGHVIQAHLLARVVSRKPLHSTFLEVPIASAFNDELGKKQVLTSVLEVLDRTSMGS